MWHPADMIVKERLGVGSQASTYHPIAFAILASLLILWISPSAARAELSRYAYSDTRNLVSLVEEAAHLIAAEGGFGFHAIC